MVLKEFIRILRSNAKTRIKSENVLKQNSSVLIRSSVFLVTGDVMVLKTVGMEVMSVQYLMGQSRFKLTMI